MGVQKQYLRTALQAIKQRYQTYEAYFQAEFGIDEMCIRDRYTSKNQALMDR